MPDSIEESQKAQLPKIRPHGLARQSLVTDDARLRARRIGLRILAMPKLREVLNARLKDRVIAAPGPLVDQQIVAIT